MLRKLLVMAAVGALGLTPLAAQNACLGKLVPIRPINLASCSTAAPACVTDQFGMNGRWVWGCPVPSSTNTTPAQRNTTPAQSTAGQVPFSNAPLEIIRPTFGTSPAEALQKEQLRTLKLQNQQLEQQQRNQAIQQQTQVPPPAAPPTPPTPTSQLGAGENQRTLGFLNGRTWNAANADMKVSYMTGLLEMIMLTPDADMLKYFGRNLTTAENSKAVDRFYEEPENLNIPVPFALQIVAKKANGESPDAVENFAATVRRTILDLQSKQTQ